MFEFKFNIQNTIKMHFKSLGKNSDKCIIPSVILASVLIFFTKIISFNVAIFFLIINVASSFIFINLYILMKFFYMSYDDNINNTGLKEETTIKDYKKERLKFRQEVFNELINNFAFVNILISLINFLLIFFIMDYLFPLITSINISEILIAFEMPILVIKFLLNYFIFIFTFIFLFTINPILRRILVLFNI